MEFCLSRPRGIAAAKAFFPKALKHHREPPSITLDGHQNRSSGSGSNGCGASLHCHRVASLLSFAPMLADVCPELCGALDRRAE